jgi:hypothetical protein
MPSQHRTQVSFVCLLFAMCALAVTTPYAVSGAGFTTVNEAVDGTGHCENGNPGVNCNLYDGKEYVWLNGGPAANGLGPDGPYFFAVLEPGGQGNPNDGGSKNLSAPPYTDRMFTVTDGEVSGYGGPHNSDGPLIRLFPYADTTNPGGVYIMAICSLARGYPVNPKDCKYDAFKVRPGAPNVNAQLSGIKYKDDNRNGQMDPDEEGLENWVITISCSDGSIGTATTGATGAWSYGTPLHAPTAGTTTCEVSEVQQDGYVQSAPMDDYTGFTESGGASVAVESGIYTVTIPNDTVSAVSGLLFGNADDTEGDN